MTNALKVTMPTGTEVVMTREFAAPRRLVFAAFTEPELLKRWFGARGWSLVECKIDLWEGGTWRFVSRGPDGGEMGHGGVYREVVPYDRLVYTESFDDQWYPGESLVTTVLTERDGTTTMTNTLRFPSQDVRDGVLRFPMERGAGESFDRLADLLATLRT